MSQNGYGKEDEEKEDKEEEEKEEEDGKETEAEAEEEEEEDESRRRERERGGEKRREEEWEWAGAAPRVDALRACTPQSEGNPRGGSAWEDPSPRRRTFFTTWAPGCLDNFPGAGVSSQVVF